MPFERLAGKGDGVAVKHRQDGQVKRIGARTAVGIGIFVDIGTTRRVGGALPRITVAGGDVFSVIGTGEHRQVKGIGTRAALVVDVLHIVGIALCQGFAIPLIALAGRLRADVMGAAEHRQVKRHDAIAALLRLEGEGRGRGALVIGDAVHPGERLAGGLVLDRGREGIDGQVEGVGAGTTLCVGIFVDVGTTRRIGGAVPSIAVAGGDVFGVIGSGEHR